MKNIDYNSLLMYVSLILAMAILISIVFGCTYKKQRGYTEFFADSEASSETKPPASPETSSKTSASSDQPVSKTSPDANLNDVEKNLKKEIKAGTINENKLTQMVESNEVSSENLKNVIDSFQTELNLK
jgi:cytoskeletal protein RodZ